MQQEGNCWMLLHWRTGVPLSKYLKLSLQPKLSKVTYMGLERFSKRVFDVALVLVFQATCRLFGKVGQQQTEK